MSVPASGVGTGIGIMPPTGLITTQPSKDYLLYVALYFEFK
jgi:hypothetical protein